MYVAGVRVREEDVLRLAGLLHDAGFDDTAEALVVALEAEQGIVGLSIQDREAILRALDDPPEGLSELRGVLLNDHQWRVGLGLVPGDVDWDS
jgi:hypothetical protein